MRRTLITAVTLISAAALVSGTGLALASSRPASPASWHKEHFRIISTVAKSDKESVIATGGFTAGGVEIIGRTSDKAYLFHGTFRIERRITFKSAPVPPRDCMFTETERGRYTIGHGTGRYAHLRGSGNFALLITGILAQTGPGRCGRMVAYQEEIYESGLVNR